MSQQAQQLLLKESNDIDQLQKDIVKVFEVDFYVGISVDSIYNDVCCC